MDVDRPGKSPVDCHHLKSRGSGGSDLTSVPLIRKLHIEVHMSQEKFEKKYHIDFRDVQIRCLILFMEAKLGGRPLI